MVTRLNDRLHEASVGHGVDLQQYATGVARRLVALLNRTDAELAARLALALANLTATDFMVERLDQLLGSVRELNAAAYGQVGQRLEAEAVTAARYEVGFQARLWEAVLPAEVVARYAVAEVGEFQVAAAALSRPFQGRLLRGWSSKLEADRLARVREQIRQGFVQGESPGQVLARLRGTRAARYQDGVLDRPRTELITIAHGAVAHAAEVAREKFYDANDDLLDAVAWTATLDTRTSELCRVRDGKRYTVETHRPVGHKVPWLQGPGRSHFRCRSCSTPVVKSWRALGFDLPELAPATRASMDGQVAGDLTYGEWLRRQTPARQAQVLGRERAELMRSGQVPFDQLYTDRGIALTLEQLQARDRVNLPLAGDQA